MGAPPGSEPSRPAPPTATPSRVLEPGGSAASPKEAVADWAVALVWTVTTFLIVIAVVTAGGIIRQRKRARQEGHHDGDGYEEMDDDESGGSGQGAFPDEQGAWPGFSRALDAKFGAGSPLSNTYPYGSDPIADDVIVGIAVEHPTSAAARAFHAIPPELAAKQSGPKPKRPRRSKLERLLVRLTMPAAPPRAAMPRRCGAAGRRESRGPAERRTLAAGGCGWRLRAARARRRSADGGALPQPSRWPQRRVPRRRPEVSAPRRAPSRSCSMRAPSART